MKLCFQISRRKKAILHFRDELARGRVLDIPDVGAGAGILFREVLIRDPHAMAVEFSFEMVKTVREAVAEGMVKKEIAFRLMWKRFQLAGADLMW